MNNLLTRTLFVSLLLSITTLPVISKNEVDSNRWKSRAKKVVIVGTGVVLMGIVGSGLGKGKGAIDGARKAIEKVMAEIPQREMTVALTKAPIKSLDACQKSVGAMYKDVHRIAQKVTTQYIEDNGGIRKFTDAVIIRLKQASLSGAMEGVKEGSRKGLLKGGIVGGLIGISVSIAIDNW